MHVTSGRVSASRRETTSYQLSQSEAAASNAARDSGVRAGRGGGRAAGGEGGEGGE